MKQQLFQADIFSKKKKKVVVKVKCSHVSKTHILGPGGQEMLGEYLSFSLHQKPMIKWGIGKVSKVCGGRVIRYQLLPLKIRETAGGGPGREACFSMAACRSDSFCVCICTYMESLVTREVNVKQFMFS